MPDDGSNDEAAKPSESETQPDWFPGVVERTHQVTGELVRVGELAAAGVFAVLFVIGVADLVYRIAEAIIDGRISDPTVVIKFVDVGLLLLIIVEVYHTVVAYLERSETREIVRLIIYTGIIAMARKVIVFRTSEYGSPQEALFAAGAYTVILLSLGLLLFVERTSA